MWKCPICQNEAKTKYICSRCGYDKRADFLSYKTVCAVPKRDLNAWNRNMSNHAPENLKDNDAERKLRMADELERQRRLKENSIEQHPKPPVKRKSRLKTIAVLLIILAAIVRFIGVFNDLRLEKELEAHQQEMSQEWIDLKNEMETQLISGDMIYENNPIENIRNGFIEKGYSCSKIDDLPSDIPEGTKTEIGFFAQRSDEQGKYEFWMDDWYGSEYQLIERELYFTDGRYKSEFVENETLSEIHNGITPLPCGIKFGDTFDEVYQKLGLNEDMIAYASDMSHKEVSAIITKPDHLSGGLANGHIFISFDGLAFNLGFAEHNDELYSYIVSIQM